MTPDTTDSAPAEKKMRLQKFLARAGVASRRGAEDLIAQGRVTVNDSVVTEMGVKVDPDSDVVKVDGVRASHLGSDITLALNKPIGYVTTMSDPQGRPTVSELIPGDEHPSLFPVGRLDLNTSGLLLFTTDGELGNALLHPRNEVVKRYRVEVDGKLSEDVVEPLRRGIVLDDGACAPATVSVDSVGSTSTATISITEGRKRQVRRMFSSIGHPVLELHRDRFGSVSLEDLPSGTYRLLDPSEIEQLRTVAHGSED